MTSGSRQLPVAARSTDLCGRIDSPLPYVAAPGAGGSTIFRSPPTRFRQRPGARWRGRFGGKLALSRSCRSEGRLPRSRGQGGQYQVTKTSTTVEPTGRCSSQSGRTAVLHRAVESRPRATGRSSAARHDRPDPRGGQRVQRGGRRVERRPSDRAAARANRLRRAVPDEGGGPPGQHRDVHRHAGRGAAGLDRRRRLHVTVTGTLTPDDKSAVVVSYAPPFPQEVIDLPVFTLKLSNTGNIVKVITLPSPPMDQPLKLPPLANDPIPPDLRGDCSQYLSFNPSGFLSFTFTEAMDPASMKKFTLLDPRGAAVAGHVVVSEGKRGSRSCRLAAEARHGLHGEIRRADRPGRQPDCRRPAPVDGRHDGDAEDRRDGDVRERDAGARCSRGRRCWTSSS